MPSLRVRNVALLASVVVTGALSAYCGGTDATSTFELPAETDGSTLPPGFGSCDGCALGPDGAVTPAAAVCGDGRITGKKGCDDGNEKSGDGCDATCNVELGWVCPNPGLRCEAASCGDGVVAGAEECDAPKGMTVAGCSATCKIEPGFDCDPKNLTCMPVVCGDGVIQRGETCEDGNDLPFDGCFKCQKETSCTSGTCKAQCGDSQRFAGEGCDDGNTRDGDGCSSTCTVETGFACADIVNAPSTSLALPVLIRDFIGVGNTAGGSTAHTDFNQLSGSGVLGIVQTSLSPTRRPLLVCPGGDCTQNPGHLYTGGASRPNISTPENFAQWYTNVDKVNVPSALTISLVRDAATGTYQWDSGNAAVNGGKVYFDPIGPTGGFVALGKEVSVCNPLRNVSFTSETHFFFEYQGGESFDFAGDDDTWVFVDGKLAIDLGGLHVAKHGNFKLDPTTGNGTFSSDMPGNPSGNVTLGLTKGGTYEVIMFQAERNQCGSNFKVTLKDFNRPKSTCASTCGDGQVASDELCDDGKNDGTYGGCMPGCKARGPFCGDGKLDPQEQCDDGNNNTTDGCSTTCRIPTVN